MHILVTNDDGVYAPGLLALSAGTAQNSEKCPFWRRTTTGQLQGM